MLSLLIRPAKIRGSNPSSKYVEITSPLQWGHFASHGVNQTTEGCAEPGLKAHVRATTEGEKRLVDISHLHRDRLRGRRSLSPHLASLLSQVGNRFTSGHFVLHPSLRLHQWSGGYAWTHQFWDNCVTGSLVSREFHFIPFVLWSSHWT